MISVNRDWRSLPNTSSRSTFSESESKFIGSEEIYYNVCITTIKLIII